MSKRINVQKNKGRRQHRVRTQLSKSEAGHPRLSVFRSNTHIYAQIIDDMTGKTLVAASSLENSGKGKPASGGKNKKSDTAKEIGKLIAERAKKAGVSAVVFDRGSYRYHGRVKSLAEGAREGGLKF